MLLRLAIVNRIPRRRSRRRAGRPQYPLSPTMRCGRKRGRPRRGRLTAPVEIKGSKPTASWRCPAVKQSDIKRPRRSVRKWTLVLNPPLLLPNASSAAVVFLHQQHVDGHEPLSHLPYGLPSQSRLERRHRSGAETRSHPRVLPCASDRNGSIPFPISHNAQASPAMVHRSVTPKGCR
jgi:hypothetical protein